MGSPPPSPLTSPASPLASRFSPSASPSSPLASPSGRPSAKPSPFARFRQLEDNATRSNPGSVPVVQGGVTKSGSGAKEMILMWVQARLKDYPIPMTNFSTCWNDGLAFAALIHVFYPENFDWHALDAQNRRHNFTLAFAKAEELADIYPLLDVDDMVKFKKPDWKCVFTYVQSFYRRFRDGRSPPPEAGLSAAGPKAPLSEVALACLASQEAEKKGKEMVSKVTLPTRATKQSTVKENTVGQEAVEKKQEEVKKKVKVRPAPLENLDDCNKMTLPQEATKSPDAKEDNNEAITQIDTETPSEKPGRPSMPSHAPPPAII